MEFLVYELIEEKDIEKYQKIFEKIMKQNTDTLEKRIIGTPGGRIEVDVFWSPNYKYWYATKEIPMDDPTRYWNAFSIEKPGQRYAKMIGQINFSFSRWRAEGLIIRDIKTKKIVVAHKGGYTRNIEDGGRIKNNILGENSEEEPIIICEFPEPLDDKSQYSNFQSKVKDFITKFNDIKYGAIDKNEETSRNNEKQTKKIASTSNGIKNGNNNPSQKSSLYSNKNESSYEITKRVREIILSINENCKLQKKKEIFDEAALFRLWGNIEKTCGSKNDFKGFAENLYKLLREATREINPNKRNKNDPHYLFRIPNNFIKNDPTKQFWDIVNTLRHYFVHDEIGNIANVYKEFLGSSSGPESPEDYSKLQIKVLNLFENSMSILLEMIKNKK